MKVVRAALVLVILADLALLAVCGPLRSTLQRYDAARKQQDLRRLTLERNALLLDVARARRPDRVAARAAALGIDLRVLENDPIVSAAGASPPARRPALNAPRQ